MKDKKLYIEMLEKFNELANSQLSFYKKVCDYLTDKVAEYEKRERELFEASVREHIEKLSK